MADEENQETAETVEIEAGAEKTEKAEPTEAETRARRMGWHPKNEYEASGRDPTKWVDAEAFMERGENELPVLRDRFRKLERITERQAKEISEGTALMRDLVKAQTENTKKAVEKAISELKNERKEAAANGDTARVEAISDEIETQKASLKPAPAEPKTTDQGKDAVPQEVVEWTEANPWFGEDARMRAFATAEYGELLKEQGLTDKQRLAKVKAEVVKRFPEKFSNPKRTELSPVEGGNGGARNRNGAKGWGDLPADAQQIGDRLIKMGAMKDRSEYLKNYSW